MRKVLVVVLAVFVFVGLGLSAIAQEKSTAPAGERKVINDKCPVSGEAISADTPFTTQYEGKTIGFCCAECISMFEADPEKYMQKINKPFTIKCPHCGVEIDLKEECMKQGKTSPMMEKKGSGTEPHEKHMHSHEGHMH